MNEITLLEDFKKDPVKNYKAAYWFSQLSFEKKQNYAKKMGQILLISSGGKEFVFGMGSEHSPYPWVLIVGRNRFNLSEGNSFEYILRNDKWVKNQWGVYWVVQQSYDTEIKQGQPIFVKSPPSKGRTGYDLWIPGTSWKYVGPKLEK